MIIRTQPRETICDRCIISVKRRMPRRANRKIVATLSLLFALSTLYLGHHKSQIKVLSLEVRHSFGGRDVLNVADNGILIHDPETAKRRADDEESLNVARLVETTAQVDTTPQVDPLAEVDALGDTAAQIDTTTAGIKLDISRPSCELQNKLLGALEINKNISRQFEDIGEVTLEQLLEGGCHKPRDCIPRQKVAVIVPYKDRESHLKKLLYHLHPMLVRQGLQYCIYIAEQLDEGQFNKAMVMNGAFEEAMKLDDYDCIVFHDVDMLPEDDRNLYVCGDNPIHLSPAIDKFDYKPDYGTCFGGVVGISPQQYRRANGHSNRFWGWGGEDNDMEYRIQFAGMNITARALEIGRYQMIKHMSSFKFSKAEAEHLRLEKNAKERTKVDGLSNLQYVLDSVERTPFYTKLMIDIQRLKLDHITVYINDKIVETFTDKPGPCIWKKFEGKNLLDTITLPDDVKLETYEQAVAACLKTNCFGIVKLNVKSKDIYELRHGNVPHNLVLSTRQRRMVMNEETGKAEGKLVKRYLFPRRTAHVYTCPGQMGSLHSYQDLLLTGDNITNTYRFEIHVKLRRNFSAQMFYYDRMLVESKEHLPAGDWQQFKYYNGKPLDFSSGRKSFSFSTKPKPLPSVPGSFLVNSRLVDQFRQPYYQWNWWFETTTGDYQEDNKRRAAFYQEQIDKRKKEQQKAREEAMKIKISPVLKNKNTGGKKAVIAMKRIFEMENQVILMQKNEDEKRKLADEHGRTLG